MIEHVRHPSIDKAAWDKGLLRCSNRMWYAQSWVLDITSPGWDALIDEQNGAIMPLTWRKKLIFKYLFQPYGSQQLGVFAPEYSDAIGAAFIRSIPQEFKFCDIAMNEAMGDMQIAGFTFSPLDQQVILLDRSVEQLRREYSQGHIRNLRKAGSIPEVTQNVNPKEFRELFVRTTAKRFNSGTPADHQRLERVIGKALQLEQCTILGLRSGPELCAAACFMEWEGRSIFYKSAVDAKGQEMKAMFRILDQYIASHANSALLLDLAGSNTPSVARFNSGFGAERKVYLRLQRNDLPIPFKWFKH